MYLDLFKTPVEKRAEWFDIQKSLLNSFCTGYHEVLPNGQPLLDYKLFCFSG